jgi:hypothetical protein
VSVYRQLGISSLVEENRPHLHFPQVPPDLHHHFHFVQNPPDLQDLIHMDLMNFQTALLRLESRKILAF